MLMLRVPTRIRSRTTEKLYKTHELREARRRKRDTPSRNSVYFLVREGIMPMRKELEALEAEVDLEIRDATDKVPA